MSEPASIEAKQKWLKEMTDPNAIFATVIIRPMGCPMDFPIATTNCAGCDEFDGLQYVWSPDGLKSVPKVQCAAQKNKKKGEV